MSNPFPRDPPKPEQPLRGPLLLLVEGMDDFKVFRCILEKTGLGPNDVELRPLGGKNDLPERMKALTLAHGFDSVRAVCVVRDADDSPDAAFQSVADAFRLNGLPTPKKAFEVVGNGLRTAAMLTAGPDGRGELEDMCLASVAEGDVGVGCANCLIDCLQRNGIDPRRKIGKRRLLAFLASKPDVHVHIGVAAEAGMFNLGSQAFAPIISTLDALKHL